jgi:hypothetical protein
MFKELKIRHPSIKGPEDRFFKEKRSSLRSLHDEEDAQDLESDTESVIVVEDPTTETENGASKSLGAGIQDVQDFQTTGLLKVDLSLNSTITSIELPPRAWHLLNMYFTYTHSWLPIVEKHDILRTYHELPMKVPATSQAVQISRAKPYYGQFLLLRMFRMLISTLTA